MSGLLGGVLPYLYSKSNALQRTTDGLLGDVASTAKAVKRHVGGLLTDPVGKGKEALGLVNASLERTNRLFDDAFADPKQPFRVTNPEAFNQLTNQMMGTVTGFAPAGITAWHGSPHKFDRFDSSKIGTGEGAQAYGHGLYLAESPEVAKQYAGLGRWKNANISRDGSEWVLSVERRMDDGLQRVGRFKSQAEAQQALDKWDATNQSVYKVDLPDPAVARMLDWDKPLSQQDSGVQSALRNKFPQYFRGMMPESLKGQDLYARMSNMDAIPDATAAINASHALRQAGIPGIRYLDGGSRGAGQGSSNFVLFPGEENLLTILERNGVPLR